MPGNQLQSELWPFKVSYAEALTSSVIMCGKRVFDVVNAVKLDPELYYPKNNAAPYNKQKGSKRKKGNKGTEGVGGQRKISSECNVSVTYIQTPIDCNNN